MLGGLLRLRLDVLTGLRLSVGSVPDVDRAAWLAGDRSMLLVGDRSIQHVGGADPFGAGERHLRPEVRVRQLVPQMEHDPVSQVCVGERLPQSRGHGGRS